MTQRIELPQCTLEMMPEGYILCEQFRDVKQTKETVKLLLDGVKQLSPEPACMLVLMNGQPTDKDARRMIASAQELKTVAMVLSSSVGTVLVNFFLRVNRPHFAMRVFNEQGAAREWILRHCDPPAA